MAIARGKASDPYKTKWWETDGDRFASEGSGSSPDVGARISRRVFCYIDGHPSVGKFWRPVLASFGQEVEQIPDGCKEVYASVV